MAHDYAAILHRWFEEVWNQGRFEAVNELASPEMVLHGLGPDGGDIGREEFIDFARTMRAAFPDMHTAIEDTIVQGDKVVLLFRSTMTHRGEFMDIAPTGRRVTVTGMALARGENGKVVEGWNHWDQLGLLAQLGAVRSFNLADRRSAA